MNCNHCDDPILDQEYYTLIEPDGGMLLFCSPPCLRDQYPSREEMLRMADAEYWAAHYAKHPPNEPPNERATF